MKNSAFLNGIKAMLPIITGVIPFGLVMGTVSATSGLDLLQSIGMNIFVFAGASQLVAVDLMGIKTGIIIVVATALIINLRMILYSAALSDLVKDLPTPMKALVSYWVTDQSYSVLVANQENLNSKKDKVAFYIGASFIMYFTWQVSVLFGFYFGNFAPKSLSLEFAVPISFVCLVLPTIKNKNYLIVGIVSATLAVFLKSMPYNLGLLTSAFIAIAVGTYLTREKKYDRK